MIGEVDLGVDMAHPWGMEITENFVYPERVVVHFKTSTGKTMSVHATVDQMQELAQLCIDAAQHLIDTNPEDA